jgi:hypothetical protein
MATHKLECRFFPRDGWRWMLPGLPDEDEFSNDPPEPDTTLWLVGHRHACDKPESIVGGVHTALYDHHQTSDSFKDGDTIESEPVSVNKYHSYDDRFGKVDVPAMRFKIISFHVVLEEPSEARFQEDEYDVDES